MAAYLERFPGVRMHLSDKFIDLVEEGIDVADPGRVSNVTGSGSRRA